MSKIACEYTYEYTLLSPRKVREHYFVLVTTYKDKVFDSATEGWTDNPVILKDLHERGLICLS